MRTIQMAFSTPYPMHPLAPFSSLTPFPHLGVYLEHVLKSSESSSSRIWTRNIKMAFCTSYPMRSPAPFSFLTLSPT
jgi:hypothetical protein